MSGNTTQAERRHLTPVGEEVERRRNALGLSRAELLRRAGFIHRTTYRNLIRADMSWEVSDDIVRRVSRAVGLDEEVGVRLARSEPEATQVQRLEELIDEQIYDDRMEQLIRELRRRGHGRDAIRSDPCG